MKPRIRVKKMLLNKIQIVIIDKMPKVIIDQGWHQKGFESQNFLLEFEFIN